MMKTKLAAVAVIAALVAPSAMAAVRPSAEQNLTLAPAQAGARLGMQQTGKKRQNVAGASTALIVAGVAAAGAGIAAAAGAFDSGNSSSP